MEQFDISKEVILKCCEPHGDLPITVTVDDIYLRVKYLVTLLWWELHQSVYIQPVTISYASEKNDQGILDDPVKDTYFYKKTKPWKAIKGDDVSNIQKWCSDYLTCLWIDALQPEIKRSELVCPQKFVTKETRLYSSPSKCGKVSE